MDSHPARHVFGLIRDLLGERRQCSTQPSAAAPLCLRHRPGGRPAEGRAGHGPAHPLGSAATACPFDLVLHVAVAVPFWDAHAIERRAHRALARCCVRNEWFDTTPAEAVAAVQAASEPVPMAVQPLPVEWQPRRLPDGTLDVLPPFGFRQAIELTATRRPLWQACQVIRANISGRSSRPIRGNVVVSKDTSG